MRNGFLVLFHLGQDEPRNGVEIRVPGEFLDANLRLFQRLRQLTRLQSSHRFALEGFRCLILHVTS